MPMLTPPLPATRWCRSSLLPQNLRGNELCYIKQDDTESSWIWRSRASRGQREPPRCQRWTRGVGAAAVQRAGIQYTSVHHQLRHAMHQRLVQPRPADCHPLLSDTVTRVSTSLAPVCTTVLTFMQHTSYLPLSSSYLQRLSGFLADGRDNYFHMSDLAASLSCTRGAQIDSCRTTCSFFTVLIRN